jgi:dephospho-CoA kinase
MLVVGLTGGIGVGKSTVAGLLGERGAAVVDVDGLGREIIAPGGRAVDAVVDRFGPQVRAADGGVDRAALAGIVFGSEEELAALNAISHPAINELLDERVDALIAEHDERELVVIFDMAVLVESTLGQDTRHPYEVVVTVEAPMDIRLDRLELRGTPRDDARARIESQATDEQRRAVSQFVVANGGDLESLEAAVDELWTELRRLNDARHG